MTILFVSKVAETNAMQNYMNDWQVTKIFCGIVLTARNVREKWSVIIIDPYMIYRTYENKDYLDFVFWTDCPLISR